MLGVLTGGFLGYLAIFNSSDLGASFLFVVFALIAAAGSIFTVYRASRIRMSDEEISSGDMKFRWRDVTDIRRVGYGIHLYAGDRKIAIAPHAYKNPDELIMFVERALAKSK